MKTSKKIYIVGFVVVVVLAIYAFMRNEKIKEEDKQTITAAFNETVALQHAIAECYIKTKDLAMCNSGSNDIPYPTMDQYKGISVYNGVITVAFISGELSKVLHGGYVELSLDTKTVHEERPKWNCVFSNVTSDNINMKLLPSIANCKFQKK